MRPQKNIRGSPKLGEMWISKPYVIHSQIKVANIKHSSPYHLNRTSVHEVF